MDLLTMLFTSLGMSIDEFGRVIANLFQNITQIFFIDNGVDGFEITAIGQLTLCAFAIGLVWTGIRWLTRLVKMRG